MGEGHCIHILKRKSFKNYKIQQSFISCLQFKYFFITCFSRSEDAMETDEAANQAKKGNNG